MSEPSQEEYYARFPGRSFIVAGIIVFVLLALVGLLFSLAASIPPGSDNADFERSFLTGAAAGGITASVGILFFAVAGYLRTKSRPFLILDQRTLTIGLVKLQWQLIDHVVRGSMYGAPFIGIRTLNDKAVLARMRPPVSWVFALRRLRTGALFVIPQMIGIPMDELEARIETFRMAAASSAASTIRT
jgi:hypothetical protein